MSSPERRRLLRQARNRRYYEKKRYVFQALKTDQLLTIEESIVRAQRVHLTGEKPVRNIATSKIKNQEPFGQIAAAANTAGKSSTTMATQ